MKFRSLHIRPLLLAAAIAAAVMATSTMAADQRAHVRGTIADVTTTGFTVQTDGGLKMVELTPDTRITGVVPSSLDDIQPGTFIGTANALHGSAFQALEVVVFPPAMKGSGLGDYAWDLPAPAGAAAQGSAMVGSAMTSGTIKASATHDAPAGSSAMTNGTVERSTGGTNRTIVVDYGSGEKVIVVPANVPVVTFKPTDRMAIAKGAHVFVAMKPDDSTHAATVAVGLDGTVPPM
jgi:hypothetical protein